MNFARDVVDAADPQRLALVELSREDAGASGDSARSPIAAPLSPARSPPTESVAATSS